MPRSVLVIPCYNESQRFPVDAFLRFVDETRDIDFLFVNDGSKDSTLEVLENLQCRRPGRFDVLDLPINGGKGEAVRQGCLVAFDSGADFVGYWDADLATPLDAIPDFLEILQKHARIELVCGARVQLLGRSIRRSRLRHYLGRMFATAASWTLKLRIYDTQCGAKLFRATPRMQAAFGQPFGTRWLFDVEILARLMAGGKAGGLTPVEYIVHELPLQSWHDQAGSKVKALDFPKAFFALIGIHWRLLRRGRDGSQWVPANSATPLPQPNQRAA